MPRRIRVNNSIKTLSVQQRSVKSCAVGFISSFLREREKMQFVYPYKLSARSLFRCCWAVKEGVYPSAESGSVEVAIMFFSIRSCCLFAVMCYVVGVLRNVYVRKNDNIYLLWINCCMQAIFFSNAALYSFPCTWNDVYIFFCSWTMLGLFGLNLNQWSTTYFRCDWAHYLHSLEKVNETLENTCSYFYFKIHLNGKFQGMSQALALNIAYLYIYADLINLSIQIIDTFKI